MSTSLREKAPEILFEAASVVFAVLLALALDEWRDERAAARLAEQARQGILGEVRANLDELRGHEATNRENFERLDAALDALGDGDGREERSDLAVDYSLSILSSSAWETARVTGVMHDLDFAWVSELSQTYELQSLFAERQADLVDYITRLDTTSDDPEKLLVPLRNRMRTVLVFQEGLFAEYEEILAAESSGGRRLGSADEEAQQAEGEGGQ